MGWGSGSELLGEVLDIIEPHVTGRVEEAVYVKLIDAFWNHDADTLDELVGRSPVLDRALLLAEYVDQDYLDEYGCKDE